jgi:membrane-associated protease RseP (regulator of RpoE activity)
LIHELGHALVQRCFGLPVDRIIFGVGPRLFRIKSLEVRLFPITGHVMPSGAYMASKPWQGVLIALSGIGLQWLTVIAIYFVRLVDYHFSSLFVIWYSFWAFFSLIELLPVGRKDGKVVLDLLLNKKPVHS